MGLQLKGGINWTDFTFNGLWGCEKISPGCKNCYAMTFDKRVGGDHWGTGKPRREFGDGYWAQPLAWEAKAKRDGRIYRVFCSSMADWLEDHPQWIEPRAKLEALVAATPNLIWLFLTKRPENWRLMPESWRQQWPSNAMFGFTGENNEWLQKRLLVIREPVALIPGIRTFLSAEPLLGPLTETGELLGMAISAQRWPTGPAEKMFKGYLDWVICGGESGPGARPMHPDWARSLRDQCAAARVRFLFKQWGQFAPVEKELIPGTDMRARMVKQGDINLDSSGSFHLFGPSLSVSNESTGLPMRRVNKKAAGRLLDGVEHNGLPLYWPPNVGMIQAPNPLAVLA